MKLKFFCKVVLIILLLINVLKINSYAVLDGDEDSTEQEYIEQNESDKELLDEEESILVESISINKRTLELSIGKSEMLVATVLPNNATNKTVNWSSSNNNIATVDSNGNIKAIAEGTATITATIDGKNATCTVTVIKSNSVTADFSNAKFDYKSKNLGNLVVTVSNYKIDTAKKYYMYISKNKNEDIDKYKNEFNIVSMNDDGTLTVNFGGNQVRKVLETIGTNYIHIIEKNNGENTYNIITTKEMPTIPLPDVGLRLDMYLYDPKDTVVINSVDISKDRKIEYRIGKITSNDILKSFKNDSSSVAFNNLLKYAKSANYIATGTITVDGLNYNIVNKLNIEEKAYYFVYMIVQNENGKYIDIEDVAIYEECNLAEGNALVHFEFADIRYEEDKNNVDGKDDAKDDTTLAPDSKLPQTGISYTIIIPIVILTIGGVIFYIKYRKYKIIK